MLTQRRAGAVAVIALAFTDAGTGSTRDRVQSMQGRTVVLVGAGDIATCGSDGDEATARLLDDIPGTVFTAGDNAYPNGTTSDYASCYGPSWGRHMARTRPAPGNHEYRSYSSDADEGERTVGYSVVRRDNDDDDERPRRRRDDDESDGDEDDDDHRRRGDNGDYRGAGYREGPAATPVGTPGAMGYFDYFGGLAGDPGIGYYSYDLGDWHILSLNSNVGMRPGSPQEQWLRGDLAANTKQCVLAYWHHPRFSSGAAHGSLPATQPLWDALYDAGAEIVIGGHEHNYERFAPQTPTGDSDPDRGIREFVVGTGGARHYAGTRGRLPNSEVFNGTTWGVLQLTLGPGTYSWQFVPVAGQSFTDSGSGTCH